MERILLPEDELIEWINSELSKHEECVNCRATSVMRLKDVDKDGCNWSSVYFRFSGVPAEVSSSVRNQVIYEARLRFNLNQ